MPFTGQDHAENYGVKVKSPDTGRKLLGLFLDCDEDVILLKIEQEGGIACHTGRESCFYRRLVDGQWQSVEPVLKDPKTIYTKHE